MVGSRRVFRIVIFIVVITIIFVIVISSFTSIFDVFCMIVSIPVLCIVVITLMSSFIDVFTFRIVFFIIESIKLVGPRVEFSFSFINVMAFDYTISNYSLFIGMIKEIISLLMSKLNGIGFSDES